MIYMYSVIIWFLEVLNIFIGLSFELLVKIFEHICAFLSSYQVMEKTEIESVRKSIYVTPPLMFTLFSFLLKKEEQKSFFEWQIYISVQSYINHIPEFTIVVIFLQYCLSIHMQELSFSPYSLRLTPIHVDLNKAVQYISH
jgi:hypothetical protein